MPDRTPLTSAPAATSKGPDLKQPQAAPPAHVDGALPQVSSAGGRVTLTNMDAMRTTLSAVATVPGIGMTDMPIASMTLTVRSPEDRFRLAALLEAMAARLKS